MGHRSQGKSTEGDPGAAPSRRLAYCYPPVYFGLPGDLPDYAPGGERGGGVGGAPMCKVEIAEVVRHPVRIQTNLLDVLPLSGKTAGN